MNTLILSRKVILLATSLLMCNVSNAQSQLLEDFRTADSVSGCASIPYSEERRRCTDKMYTVDENCKAPNYSCKSNDITTPRYYLGHNTGIDRILEQMKATRDELKNNRYSSDAGDTSALDERIDTINRDIDKYEKQKESNLSFADGAKREILLRIKMGNECLALRNEVQGHFSDAISKARNESDAEIVPIAQRLMSKWGDSSREHQQAVLDTKNAVEICEKKL